MFLLLLKISSLLYVVAAVAYLGHLLAPRLRSDKLGTFVLLGALALHLASIIDRWIELGVSPIAGYQEGLSLLGFFLAGVYVFLQLRYGRPVLGAFVTPLAAVLVISAVMLRPGAEVPEVLRNTWLVPVHVSMALLGDAALAVAAAVAVLYLILESKMKRKEFGGLFGRLPSLEALDALNLNLVRFGFVLLSLAIITGTLWAGRVWHSYFDWEPRQTSALVVWFLYALLLTSRWVVGWRGRRAALITLAGFVLMVGSFVGLRLFDLGRHGGTYT